MKNKILFIVIGMFMINLVPALSINSGECESIQLDTTKNLYWTVIGNSSSMEGLNITYETFSNYTNVTICLHPMFQTDSFNLVFMEEIVKEVIKEVQVSSGGGGGGGSRTTYVTNETIVEVDNYLDREVIVEKEKEIESIEKVEVIKNLSFLEGILLFLFATVFYIVVFTIYKMYFSEKQV